MATFHSHIVFFYIVYYMRHYDYFFLIKNNFLVYFPFPYNTKTIIMITIIINNISIITIIIIIGILLMKVVKMNILMEENITKQLYIYIYI